MAIYQSFADQMTQFPSHIHNKNDYQLIPWDGMGIKKALTIRENVGDFARVSYRERDLILASTRSKSGIPSIPSSSTTNEAVQLAKIDALLRSRVR